MLLPVALLVALAAAAGSPSPSPTPSATPTPILSEIAHVRTSPLCTDFSTHANSLIGSATRNDISLSQLVSALRQSDGWDENELRRHQRILALTDYADQITAEYKRAETEAGRLRDLAKRATDKDEQAAIVASADALAGAVWRQRKIARDLDGFIAYMHAEDIGKVHDGEAQMNQSVLGNSNAWVAAAEGDGTQVHRGLPPTGTWRPGDLIPGTYDPPDHLQAEAAATEFETHFPEVAADEKTAAGRIIVAAAHC